MAPELCWLLCWGVLFPLRSPCFPALFPAPPQEALPFLSASALDEVD